MESLRESTTQWIQNKIKDIQNQQRRKDIELIRRYEYVKDGIEALEKDVESPETDIEEAMRKT